MMKFKRNIPNLITLLNLASGLFSIWAAFNGDLVTSSVFIFIAAVFDFMDGTVARLLNSITSIGKELDSLADIVSFGVAPGFIIYHLLLQSNFLPQAYVYDVNIIPFISFIIPLFGALRLAKFNIDVRQTNVFFGLPIPAVAIFIASIPLVIFFQLESGNFIHDLLIKALLNSFFLILITVLLSVLMILDIQLFSLKFRGFTWNENRVRYLFLLISIVLIMIFYFISIPIIIFLYIIISIVNKKEK